MMIRAFNQTFAARGVPQFRIVGEAAASLVTRVWSSRVLVPILTVILCGSVATGAEPGILRLRTGDVDTSLMGDILDTLPPAFVPGERYVLGMDGPMTPQRRATLEAAGVELGDYLPLDAYVVRLGDADPVELAGLDFVRWLGTFQPAWKVQPDLGSRVPRTPLREESAEAGLCQAVVVLFPDEDPTAATAALQACGVGVLGSSWAGDRWMLDVALKPTDTTLAAQLPSIQFIEDAPEVIPRNDSNAWIAQSNVIGQTPIWDHGLHGEGELAGIIDGTIRESHCAFDDVVPVGPAHRKIVAMRYPSAESLHGTHVAGTLAGDRDAHGVPDLYDGIALAAKISFSDVFAVANQPSTLFDRLLDAHNDGARVHSNSWGDDSTTAYTTWCRQIDQFSYQYEESLVVFAVSNSATIKTPENAKNVLAVAAAQDAPYQDYPCSGGTGPTFDARRKPELYAPGCGTLSADFNPGLPCAFIGLSGTSTACPVVAGAGLLVRQYFREGYYPSGTPTAGNGFIPSGALIKATLINSAADMTGIAGYPSDLEGWGRVVLDQTLHFAGGARALWVRDVRHAGGLATGETHVHQFRVTGVSQPLRITLAFTEPAATVGAADPVVNDVDLEVVTPIGVHYLGNRFDGGASVPGGFPDPRNNVEQVHLTEPHAGLYTVLVKGAAVRVGRQGYALVATGQVSSNLASPDCNSNGVPDEQDMQAGTSSDCQPNGLPDECEALDDCNSNGLPDVCETGGDCNANGVPDECEMDRDCNSTGVPDDCEGFGDCNGNGWPDSCDVARGTSQDCQPNGIPDECEAVPARTVYTMPEYVPIPDNDPVGVSRSFFVPDHRTILDLDVDVRIEHSLNGDLVVRLAHPSVQATLIDRPGYPTQNPEWGYQDAGFDVVLDDSAFTLIETFTAIGETVVGTFRPYPDGLASFNGLDAYGLWTITVSDMAWLDEGMLKWWSLHVTEPPGPVPGCQGPGDCNGNGAVDLGDLAGFEACLAGPASPVPSHCGCADMNGDAHADLLDFAGFQQAFDAEHRPVALTGLP